MGIQVNGINKKFGDNHVLKDVSFKIDNGEFVSVVGRSGSGKSTLLYIVSTLDEASSGDLLIDGDSISKMSVDELHRFRNLKMGFVFQFHYLLPELTTLENVLMPAYKCDRVSERKNHALALLKEFGIADKKDRLPSQLSGGEQQRAAIARALVMEPNYVFADEPTGNLDSANGIAVMNLFSRISKVQKTTIVFVTHDKDFAAMASRQIVMVDGRLG